MLLSQVVTQIFTVVMAEHPVVPTKSNTIIGMRAVDMEVAIEVVWAISHVLRTLSEVNEQVDIYFCLISGFQGIYSATHNNSTSHSLTSHVKSDGQSCFITALLWAVQNIYCAENWTENKNRMKIDKKLTKNYIYSEY